MARYSGQGRPQTKLRLSSSENHVAVNDYYLHYLFIWKRGSVMCKLYYVIVYEMLQSLKNTYGT